MNGKCYYCKNEFSKSGILRHLNSCTERKNHIEFYKDLSEGKKKKFILAVSSKYEPSEFWVYIGIDENATLKELDRFLRDVWLECCGHLSQFDINGITYDSDADESENNNWFFGNASESMDIGLKKVINVGNKIKYEYDFGSTTYLEIKVLDEFICGKNENKIQVMARNNAHKEGKGLEYINSPRAGVCGYYGRKEDELKYLPDSDQDKSDFENGYVEDFQEDREGIDNIGYVEEFQDIDNEDEYLRQLFDKTMKKLGQEIRQIHRAESKMWKVIDKKFTLKYLLGTITKREILTIAENLNINKVSNLKKENLINRIAEEYEEKLNIILQSMDKERFNYLLNLVKRNSGFKKSNDYIDVDYTYYFRELGIIFTGIIEEKYAIIMPGEIQDIILKNNTPEFKKQLKRNEEITRLFWGMCYYYGIIDLNEFKNLVTRYIDYDISNMKIDIVLENAADFYDEFELNGRLGMYILVNNPIYILNEQGKRGELDYYPFTKEQLLEVTQEDYTDNSKAYKNFYKFLIENFDADHDEVEELIFVLTNHIKNNDNIQEVISDFLTTFDVMDTNVMNLITSQAIKYANNTRRWTLKGYTSQELNPAISTVVNDKKVGRNDPCPCGSGKKYKKCCGSKVISLKEFKE